MAYTNPLDELKRLRMQTEQEYLQAREFATSRAKEIKTSPPDIGALRRLESEAGDYSRQKDPIVEAFQQPKKERSPILDAFSTGARTFSYITDRLISGATFGLSDVVGKAVESGISKISGKDIDISLGYQPSETVKAVGDVAGIAGGLLTGGMLLKGIKTVAAPVLSKVATSITQFVKGIHPAVKAGAGIGAGATAFETTRGAIDPDYADRRDTFPSQFGAGLRVGTGQLLETTGAVAKWKEQDKLAKTLTSKGEAIREGFDEAEPVEYSWRAWFDPDFYAVNVARTVPMTAALIPAMFAGWKIGGGTGARLGLGPFARTVAASLGGATLSRPLESALEAGDTYDQMYQQEISKGKSEEEAHNIADRAAQEVFNKNLALVGMDAAQLAVAFTPYTRMGGRIGSMLANRIGQAGIAAGKLAFEAGSEAGEEALQYAFQQQAMGEEIDWSSPEAKEAMAIGGLFGGVLGGAGVVNDAVKARMAANLPPEQKTILSQSIENKLEQGMTEEEAVERAFDEFAETPEGKEAIREITAEVANEIEEEVWKQVEALESFEMESAVEDKSPTAEEEIQPVSVEEPTAIESQEQVEIPEPVTLEEQVQPMATEEQVLPVAETETVAVPTPEVAADIAEPESQPEAVAETASMPVEEKAVVEPAVEPVEEPVTEPSAPATEAVPVKKDRSKITAIHLRKQAQAMQKTIDAKRNPAIAKQRPTARRANIAAGMANEADTLEDIQTKVNIVAQAIEDRTIPESLAGITKKTQVETLRKLLKEKYPKMGATLGKYSAQDLLAATEGVKGSAQLRKNLKAKLDALGQDEHVIPIRTKAELQEIETLVRMAGDKLDNYTKSNIKDSLADFKRLLELGIDSQDKLDQAISDFKELTQDDGRPKEITKEQKIKAAERELIGTKIEGYFPTPKAVVERMLEEADIQPGMKVLEPSAGKGNIADAIKEAEPQADLDVIEINSRLRDILEAKGHNIVGYDFLEYNEAKYDRIVMNPPFEKGQDIDHVKHAYDLLKPGGRVVSIMSEGPFFRGDKKAAEFRDWLEENEGTSEKLPKGSFESSERPTGVATRLVVINKPEAVTETVQAQVPVQTEEITPLPTEVTTQTRIPSGELSTEQLVQRIKTLSNDPQSAYGLFVKERNLKPEINAKQFMQIWESVSANPHVRNLTTSFQPTHIDTLTGKQVQITDDGNVYKLVWENGLTGSDPKTLFDVKRYEPLGKVADTSLPADKEIESLLNEMQSRQSEEAVSLVFTIDKIKQAFNAVVDKWTFKGKLDSSGWAKQYQRAKIWEKNGKFRIYVPHDEYSQAGYVTMDANDVPKGSTSGQHKGLYYSAVSSQKEKTLISFIDDIIEYLNKEVKTSERAVEDQTAVAVGEGQVVRKGRISRIDNRLPLRDFRDKEYGEVNITRGKVYSGEPRTNIGENVLRKHQKDGVEHAIAAIDNYGGFILADGTGAGKTMQELVVAAHYAQHHNTVLIVVPNRAIINKAFRQDAQTLGIEGLLNVLGGESLPIKGKINLTTYASLKKVAGTDIDYVIFDEAHYLKNKDSAQSRTGKSVAAKAKGVLYATATPIDKAEHIHYLEGTGLFKNNSFSGIMRELGYAYEEMSIGGRIIGKWVRKVTRPEAESLLEAFFDELGDLGLIIKREISMDNIEVFVKTVPLPSEVHSKLAQIESYYNSLDVGEGLQKALALMAQRRWQEPYKVNVVMETIDNELKAGRQVVVFAARIEDSEVESIVLTDKSEGTLETLRSQLEEKGINVSAIYGSGNVDKAISDFQKGKTKVALVTPQKGGAGLSLDDVTGDAPRTMIIMTPPFSAVDNVQMAGRINRLTTKSKGRIIYLIADTDIDAWNMEIIASKIRSLNASVKGDVIKLDLTQTQKESAQLRGQQEQTVEEGVRFKTGGAKVSEQTDYAPVFYSQLQRVIEQKMPNRATTDVIKNIIGKGAVKEEEIKWSGLDDWLNERVGQKVTKQEVLDYLRANDVQIIEVAKAGSKTADRNKKLAEIDKYVRRYAEGRFMGGADDRVRMAKKELERIQDLGYLKLQQELKEIETGLAYPKWGSEPLVLPGGKNYRELLFILREDQTEADFYQSSHWSELNVLAHVRFNDRTGPDGERILHIEEIQSDWGQDLRKGKDVPDMPFAKTWHEFVLKRMLRYAAENGYDAITWTTGEQQAERYDLSKHIKKVVAMKSGNETYLWVATKDGEPLQSDIAEQVGRWDDDEKAAVVPNDKLPEIVGGDLSKKILQQPDGEEVTYSDLDLRVGGEGMKGFYDRIIPAFLNKYGKKWGARVEADKINIGQEGYETVHSFPITDAMRESVLYEGQPKFKAQPGTPEADLAVLRRAIKQRRLGPITINKVELAPEALSRPEFQATSAIAEKLGLRVVAFKGKGARGIQSGRTIYLNASLKDPLDYVFWHEVGHTMEVTHPEHYDRLMGIALDHIQDVHKLQSHYKAQDYALENMPHEFAADVFAESLTTPGFFERLKNEAPELIKPLLEAIEQLIARIKQAVSKDDSVLPYLRDVEALQERIRKEVVEPYFKDAMGEKQFVEMFGHKWQERYKLERSKKPVKETKFNLQNPEVQERMEAAAGIPQKTTRDKLTESFEAFKRKISREYEWLPRTGEFAELRQALLNLGKQKSVSADKTIRGLREIVKPMNEYEYSLFTYKVIFDDLAHEAAEGRLLPFGLTPEILEIEKAAVDRDVEQNAKVKEAIRKRKQIWDRIIREFIQANEAIGHKVDEKLKKEDYYRHQVLEYANAKGITGTGRKLRTPSYRGYLRKRKGSTFDINTDYLQAEFEVMAQMHYDTMIARTIQVVKQHYDIVPQLKAQAIALNNENIMPIFEQMAESNVTAQKLYRMTLNKKQAIALNQLEKMAAKGELPDTPNGKYADVIEYLSARYLERELKKDSAIDTDISFERVMSEDEYNKRLFEYLGWLTKQPTSQAKIAALTYFKGRKEKERFIKDRLGDAYVTWQDLIPEGYVEWQPREGSVFYMASSIPEHVAEALYSEALESVGVTGDMLKKVLAKGQKFPAMVVKEEVALTLDNLVTSINKDNPFVQVLRAWKQWQTISPKRFLKYNIRNFTGDLDALITGNPRAILKVPQAWAELRKAFFSKGHEMSPMLEEWFKRGGFETLFQAQEIYDINRNRQFRHLMEFKLKRTPIENLINAPKNAWYKYWDFARKATDFREALLRYACFLDYAEQIQNSPDGNPLNYGASNREEIKGLKDPLDRAFKLANELLGAYDEVSVVGAWLSDHLLPFWRWNEVNFVRYIRLFKNAYQDGKLLAAVGRRVAGMPIRSVVLAMHIGKFVLRLCAFSAMITAWNMLFFRDEEDDLPEDVKSRFHIIFGRDDQGNVLYFPRLGALQDFLDWFGLDSAHIHIQNLLSGKRNVQEVVTEMAKAPLVKIGTALGPHVTIPVGLFLKQQLYPDPLEPRRVRDEWEFIFDSFGLKDEYRELTGKPTMGYGRSLYNVVAYKSDPLQAAYYSIKDEKIRFMKKLNKQSYDYAVVESPKSDALYNFKLALRYKDAEAAKKYLLEYFYAGGTTRGLKQSLKSLHPLHGLKDAEKKAFILQLDSEGREDLVKALEYYRSILNPE